jgi:hypothetical protein
MWLIYSTESSLYMTVISTHVDRLDPTFHDFQYSVAVDIGLLHSQPYRLAISTSSLLYKLRPTKYCFRDPNKSSVAICGHSVATLQHHTAHSSGHSVATLQHHTALSSGHSVATLQHHTALSSGHSVTTLQHHTAHSSGHSVAILQHHTAHSSGHSVATLQHHTAHSSGQIHEWLQLLDCELLDHSAYKPGLVPSDLLVWIASFISTNEEVKFFIKFCLQF